MGGSSAGLARWQVTGLGRQNQLVKAPAARDFVNLAPLMELAQQYPYCPYSLPARLESEHMEHMIQLHIEKLPEGVYLATSDDVQGLVAQGRTIQETIEIARDVAKKLIEAHAGGSLPAVAESFDYPVIIAT
jgi:predicted RNase H-like HicB family nuclease